MRWLQPRQHTGRPLSDEAACRRARTAARLAACAPALLWLAWLPAAAGPAPDGDPLHSPECLRARAELEAAVAAPRARHSLRLTRARHAAQQACLGKDAAARQRAGAPDAPLRVPAPLPVPSAAAAAAAAPAPDALPAPPLSIPRPSAITTCDPGGCWDSEGRRLNQMGPLLVGPRGVCTVQGAVVNCP